MVAAEGWFLDSPRMLTYDEVIEIFGDERMLIGGSTRPCVRGEEGE